MNNQRVDLETIARLQAFPDQDAIIGRADQEALDLPFVDGQTVRQALHMVLENALKRLVR